MTEADIQIMIVDDNEELTTEQYLRPMTQIIFKSPLRSKDWQEK